MKVIPNADVKLTATLVIDEAEARALDGLVGYGFDEFVSTFYQHLGSHYLKPHEAGLKSLFESVRESIPPMLRRTDDARKVFKGEKVARDAE